MKRKFTILLIGVLVVLQACDRSQKVTESGKIVVGYLPILPHLPAKVAESKGYFENAEVEFRIFGNSNDLLTALLNGEVDAATTVAFAPVARQISVDLNDGKEPRIEVFSYSKTTKSEPFDGIFVDSSSGIKSVRDLSGKRIGMFPGTTASNILRHFLKDIQGLNTDSIEFVALPPSLQLDRLRDGSIDALFTYETVRTAAENGGARKIFDSVIAEVLDGAPYGCSAINSDFRRKNPVISSIFIKAFDRGIDFTKDSEFDARVILQRDLSVPTGLAETCNIEKRLRSDEISSDENMARVEAFLKVLQEIGDIEFPISAKDIVR